MKSAPRNIEQLHETASRPNIDALNCLRELSKISNGGDIVVLGAGGKMGFHLSAMIRRGLDEIKSNQRLVAISRFANPAATDLFRQYKIETLSSDLTDPNAVSQLPDAALVFFLAGVKFGTADSEELLHQMNVVVPSQIAQRYAESSIVALSSGCVYSFCETNSVASSKGSTEIAPTDPPGDYAKSCLGRESAFINSPARVSLVRLNYSVDLRYGVLVDLAIKVLKEEPIDVTTGYVNVIWQGDANRYIIQAMKYADRPPYILNVTGARVLRVRDVAIRLGEMFEKPVHIVGTESPTAWLNDASKSHQLFGQPEVTESELIEWVAHWVKNGGETLNKPTHFEVRDGKY